MDDPYLVERYDQLHLTPVQQKFRRLAPIPVGVVFIEHPGMSEEDIREHLRLMKKLGFTCLKQFMLCPGSDPRRFMHLALDEGIIPWWYAEGGWEDITPELTRLLGLPDDLPVSKVREHPAMLAYQMKIMRARVDGYPPPNPIIPMYEPPQAPFDYNMELATQAVPVFVDWLKKVYQTPQEVFYAWNQNHAGNQEFEWEWSTWEEVEKGIPQMSQRDYRHTRDIIRFKSDILIQSIRARASEFCCQDRDAPFRAGGEMGIFLPFAARSTDMEGIAEEMSWAGSFYPSIHLAWHFEESSFEVPRSVYMQASLSHDWFKGGWSATWESTGGPQQLSGGKGWNYSASQQRAGFTVDGGVMTQLMLSYLAAGFKGFGLWCWNGRSFGWEAGEYALLDRAGRPTERAVQAGQIGQAALRFRDELWSSHKEPLVGILYDYDNEAMWAAISVLNRDLYKHIPVQARIGVSRALIDGNIPFEYVTATDLRQGLAGRYRVIFLPAIISLSSDLLTILTEYVRQGGRLVLDSPSAWYDEYSRLTQVGAGSALEQLFGCILTDWQFSSNVPRYLQGDKLEGFVLDLDITRANLLATFDDGRPAVTQHAFGRGTAVVLGFEASLACANGDSHAEERLRRLCLGDLHPPFCCEQAITYRICSAHADHFFLINDGPATIAKLTVLDRMITQFSDAISGEIIDANQISVPAFSGRWIRARF